MARLLFLIVLVAGHATATTIQDFDAPGTTYTLTQHDNLPGASVQGGGPDGNFLRLAAAGTSNTLNTIAFDLTDAGARTTNIAEFDFRMRRAGTGADGLGFVLLDTGTFGTSGDAPRFAERPLVPGSLGIGFDIFGNPETSDPNNNFLRLTYDGSIVATVANPGVSLATGSFLHAHLLVEAITGGANVTLTLTPSGGAPVLPLDRFFVPGYVPYEARGAFGARTGGLSADHDIDNVRLRFIPEPGSAFLLGLGLAALAVPRFWRAVHL